MTTPYFGFDSDDINLYCVVEADYDIDESGLGWIHIEVRAELSYEGMSTLVNKLDKIIQKYDSDAYFDFVDAGVVEAYLRISA